MKTKKHVKDTTSSEVEVLREQLARSLADYDNFRKRVEREREEMKMVITAQLIARLLPVFDMLYDAQAHLNDAGIGITLKEFEETLKNEGLQKVKAEKGMKFTEELHEAIEVVDSKEVEKGCIISVVLAGWKFENGPVVRHARVVVNNK